MILTGNLIREEREVCIILKLLFSQKVYAAKQLLVRTSIVHSKTMPA